MNAKLVAGLAVLGVLGGAALMLALSLMFGGMNAANQAHTARKDVAKVNVGLVKWVNDRTGASQLAEEKIKEKETQGLELVVGAVFIGIVGMGVMAVLGILLLVNITKKSPARPGRPDMHSQAGSRG